MTLKEEIAQGENVVLEFKVASPQDSLKYLKMKRFYSSMTDRLMRDGVSDMHCMSVRYLAEEILDE